MNNECKAWFRTRTICRQALLVTGEYAPQNPAVNQMKQMLRDCTLFDPEQKLTGFACSARRFRRRYSLYFDFFFIGAMFCLLNSSPNDKKSRQVQIEKNCRRQSNLYLNGGNYL